MKLATTCSILMPLLVMPGLALGMGDSPKPRDIYVGGPERSLAEEPADQRLLDAYTQFGFRLFGTLTDEAPEQNVFISPASVALALSMTWNGAVGGTEEAMADALGLRSMTPDEVNAAAQILLSKLVFTDEVDLSIANSLWAREGIPFRQPFLDANRTFYGARVEELDFADPDAPDEINGWVNDATNGLIDGVVDRIPPDAILYLINAIYFKGTWEEPFDESRTRPLRFNAPDGAFETPIMHRGDRFPYLERESFSAVQLRYGEGRFRMFVFLPDTSSSLAELTESLTPENWEQWRRGFSSRQGMVGLPRFTLEYEEKLKTVLSAMGLAPAFDREAADFSGMVDPKVLPEVWIDEVVHKSFLDVNEKGTEAAAVTSVRMEATMAMPQRPFVFVVDRPFFLAITDEGTGLVLFMGAINSVR